MKFIESARFMASSTSNFSDDLTVEIDKINAKIAVCSQIQKNQWKFNKI